MPADINDRLLKALETKDKNLTAELIAQGANPNASSATGAPSPLWLAIDANSHKLVSEILAAGAYPNLHVVNHPAPIHQTLSESYNIPQEILTALLQRGADPNLPDHRSGFMGWTPLHHAARRGYKDGVLLLLEKGADPAAKTPSGLLPRDVAALFGYNEIAQLADRIVAARLEAELPEAEPHPASVPAAESDLAALRRILGCVPSNGQILRLARISKEGLSEDEFFSETANVLSETIPLERRRTERETVPVAAGDVAEAIRAVDDWISIGGIPPKASPLRERTAQAASALAMAGRDLHSARPGSRSSKASG